MSFSGGIQNMHDSRAGSGKLNSPVILRDHAREVGLPSIGVAAAGPTEHTDVFEAWLAGGRAAGLDYLRRHAELRRDPRALFPAARSLVIAALPYPVNPCL